MVRDTALFIDLEAVEVERGILLVVWVRPNPGGSVTQSRPRWCRSYRFPS
jgi:hypothetical protein